MSTCIVCNGIAGYMSAIKIKYIFPYEDVVMISGSLLSNSIIAGQRFLTRKAGGKVPINAGEVAQLLIERNNLKETKQMREFLNILEQEMNFWLNFESPGIGKVFYEDKMAWFGPRLGMINEESRTRGHYILTWLKRVAKSLMIQELKGEILKITQDSGSNNKYYLIMREPMNSSYMVIQADKYILAAGGCIGYIFESTNVPLYHSSHSLMYDLGCTFINADRNMFHPFSRAKESGDVMCGCYETDNLTDVSICFTDGTTDKYTMDLLNSHRAHYYFPEICRKFINKGGITFLKKNTKETMVARVSIHSSGLGLKTIKGVQVSGFKNILAVGDASSIGYWNGNQIRIPGMALSKCMVDAYLATREDFSASRSNMLVFPYNKYFECETYYGKNQISRINTNYLVKYNFANEDFTQDDIVKWARELISLPFSILREISLGVVYSHFQRLKYKYIDYTSFSKSIVEEFKREIVSCNC